MMISYFRLRSGSAPGTPAEEISTTPINIFVGPNNSGKSKVLSELRQYCHSGQNDGFLVLEDARFVGLPLKEAIQAIEHIKQTPTEGESLIPDYIIVGGKSGRTHVNEKALTDYVQDPYENLNAFCSLFLTHKTLMLDGRSRIDLVNQQSAGDLQRTPQSSLQVLFRDKDKREEVRRIIEEAFEAYFVIDPTNLGYFRIRLSERPPASSVEEQGLHEEARTFHNAAQPIEVTSDGVKAFTGMITEIIAGDPSVILVDEPEAFLHPPLASKLGYEIARTSVLSNKRVFVSTHSPTFVMGCIQSGTPLNIIRLTYRGNVATSRLLPSDEILKLMRNPLLRSTGVLNGLFYEFVVITESDTDRAFYQEINERLLRFRPDWGIPNCLFINAQNKQTIHTIMKPLRKLGIPTVGIVDIDVLKEGGVPWMHLLEGAYLPPISIESLATTRRAVKQAMDNTGKNMKREGGISILERSDQEAAKNLLLQLNEYGIFTVPYGELEAWLKWLEVGGKGPSWLVEIFERMGEDPEAENYLRPSEGDVWSFMASIRVWLTNSERKGIPL